MDGSFVRELIEQARPAATVIDGIDFSHKSFEPIMMPLPATIMVHSLGAIVDYCENELIDGANYIIHIKGPGEVFVKSRLSSDLRQRETFLKSGLVMDPFVFGVVHNVENFIVSLQAQFVQNEVSSRILSLVGNITAEAKTTTEDDGVTQRVTAKAGIVSVEEREVPNPVTLRPYRTFTEIEQPESKFILRISACGPTCALYEADGGAWKNEAIGGIRDWLSEKLQGCLESGVITILS
jgi:hypothetical protein